MNTDSIPGIYVNFWAQRNEIPKVNYIIPLRKPATTRQRTFKTNYINYDKIKDAIYRMECVEYNNNSGRNIVNEYDLVGTSDILKSALFSNQYYNRKKIYRKFIHVKDMPYHVSRMTSGLSGSGEIWGIARIASSNHFYRII